MQQGPKLWKYVVIPLGIGIVLFAIFGGVAYFLMNGSKTSRYNQAVNAYTAGNYEDAAKQFEKLGDYRDAKKRSAEAVTLMHYTNGKLAFQSGEYVKAKEEYLAAGDYENAKLLAEECDRAAAYASGETLASSGELDRAIEEYKKSGYMDYKDKLADIYVKKSDKALADGQSDKAMEFAKTAADYKDSQEPVWSCYYKMGEDAFAKNDLKNAASYFVNAKEYKDAPDKAKSIYYTLGTEALGKKDYENAANFLKLAEDFKDTKTIAKEAFYITATNRYNEKNYAAASEFFKLAGSYKDSNTRYQQSMFNTGILLMREKKFSEAVDAFDACGSYKFAKDMINVCVAESQVAANKIFDAYSTYKKVSSKVKVSGFDVQGRKAFISRWYSMAMACGDYGVMTNWVTVRKKRTGRGWYLKTLIPNQALSLKYSVNEDGTFNVAGVASWSKITNCPANKANVKLAIIVSDFELSHVKSLPKTIKLSGGAKLTRKSGGKFVVSYKKTSKGIQYQSSIVYK